MSSPSDRFECHWQASRLLLAGYLSAQLLALVALYWLDIPGWAAVSGVVLCLAHGLWVVPRSILLSSRSSFTALRRDRRGWQLWSEQGGWQPVQLCRDSLALPWIVILRFRLVKDGRAGRYLQSLCIPRDALTPDSHRRLRVRLKFSPRRWAVPE
ncbi:protein YgfX [Pseudomonas cichorii]|uniref:protein YgfX n=1 Tax=Pseudomonas cichorii TaxID=36746 RepID=UPI000F000AC8|nr:protein YgfX [Pseudomonas cichorii]